MASKFRGGQTETCLFTSSGISVKLIRKNIKNMYLRVCLLTGSVRISAPKRVSSLDINAFVQKNAGWIQTQRRLHADKSRNGPLYASGKKHYFMGIPLTLKVVHHQGSPAVGSIVGNRIFLYAEKGSSPREKEAAMQTWYREELMKRISPLIAKWETIMGIRVSKCGIRPMKTRWGSCSVNSASLRLNLELAKMPESCLEYIVVHEMSHLLERGHGSRHKELMDTFLPGWRRSKKLLAGSAQPDTQS